MTDRIALLAAIEAAPLEDAPRLAFADYLLEHDCFGSDLCRATVEFVTLSCGKEAAKTRQYVPEGRWLQANWRRLVPQFAGRHVHRRPHRSGRWLPVTAEFDYPPAPAPEPPPGMYYYMPATRFHCAVRLEFWRGFLRRCLFESPLEIDLCVPVLAADQPLLMPDLVYGPHPPVREGGPSKLTYGDMGPAFAYLPGGTDQLTSGAAVPTVSFGPDPMLLRVRHARASAFRAYARDLAGLPEPRPVPEAA